MGSVIMLLLLAVVLANVYSQHGTEGVRLWFAAKFANRNYSDRRPR